MKYGARNNIKATVTSVKKGDVMALVKFKVTTRPRCLQYLPPNPSKPWTSNRAMQFS
jgi:hypothetical protein